MVSTAQWLVPISTVQTEGAHSVPTVMTARTSFSPRPGLHPVDGRYFSSLYGCRAARRSTLDEIDGIKFAAEVLDKL